jgi:hypothetical protein
VEWDSIKIKSNTHISFFLAAPGSNITKKIPSGPSVMAKMTKEHPISFTRYDSCPNGCYMYVDDYEDEQILKCPTCKSDRYIQKQQSQPRSHAHVNVASIASIIKNRLQNPLTRQQMRYRVNRQTGNGGDMNDIFDGLVYKTLVKNNDQQTFANDDDVAIGLYIDGFSIFRNSKAQGTLVNMVIYNIPPHER